ncbi:MAG TPA: type IV secretion system DNA-binding domain-containing protein [Rhizomicrobium sp.]|jgi:hypothetical protein|nr:type IV secretion system DNA-binding domain-containing protein [Rhizomicrobium sp.]
MDDFKPSAFTPFLRRFTDERARDDEDTRKLYRRVAHEFAASPFSAKNARITFGANIWAKIERRLPDSCVDEFADALWQIIEMEPQIFRMPVTDFKFLTLSEAANVRSFLRRKEHFHAHEDRIASLLDESLTRLLTWLADALPQAQAPSPFTIPLIHALGEPRVMLDRLLGELHQERYKDAGLYIELFRTLWLNLCAASGIADAYAPNKPLKFASESDLPLHELVEVYLKATPFYDLFLAPIPLRFTFSERFNHMHVLGGSGAGKTTLLQNLVLNDLKSDDPPSLVIVDSQGDLIDKLSHLDLFDPDYGALAERLVLITPKDIRHPPALNIFDVNRERLGRYDEVAKEQVVAGVIQTFDYLFAGLLGADLTAKQSVFFRFVARLMLALPATLGRNATILDMLALMDDAAPYRAAIESLPPIQRQFFERDFASKTFVQTKEQIRYRLNAILENPTLARLFTVPDTKIDLFTVLNQGGIVLVDTAKDFLKGASGHFGRIFISLVLQAVLERAAIPESHRRPTFLIVDEAAAYFDSNMDDFLTEARKYKCGCVFAHQFLDQATSSLRASLAANTAIKLAGGVSVSDAKALAPDMRTTADFIASQPMLQFACHIRGVTPNAVSIPIPVGQLENEERLSDEAYQRLLDSNREKVSLPFQQAILGTEPDATPPPSAADPAAASEEW